MIRVILFLAAILAATTGLSWLADRPWMINVTGGNHNLSISVFHAVVLGSIAAAIGLFLWTVLRQIWNGPAAVGSMLNRRRQKQGLEAISSGMIAVGAGDRAMAIEHAKNARKSLPNEPLTHLLRAQAAQLAGDKVTSRRIYEAMLNAPDTKQLGLRGLFLEAQREQETEAAKHFAEQAVALNPKLGWASDALFDIQCRASDWEGALETLAVARRNKLIEKEPADRRRAVLLTGQAMAAQDQDPNKALNLALQAHNLAPDLIPAANLAGRMLASKGSTSKAAKVLQTTWALNPHPDLATANAYARIGDSPRDRLERTKQLAALNPQSPESAIALANAAIDARAFADARTALEPLLGDNLTQRVATLMARIESEQKGDKGRVREWLARAVNADRDPVWTADGVVSEQWAPISPVSGALDAFQWRVAVESLDTRNQEVFSRRVDELVALGAADPITSEPHTTVSQQAATTSPASSGKVVPKRAVDVTDVETIEPTVQVKSATPVTTTTAKPTTKMAPEPVSQPTPAVNLATPATATSATVPHAQQAAQKATQPTTATAPSPAARPVTVATSATPTKKPADISNTTGKEPRIFVVPPAPDDPGLDDTDPNASPKGGPRPYRVMP
jgi:HemY protein